MANETPNLKLPLDFLGMVPFRNQIKKAFGLIDTAVGGVDEVEILDGAGGDPVDGDLAAKLAAMEARIVALETA